MRKFGYLLISLAILTGYLWSAIRGGQAAAASRRATHLPRAPRQVPVDAAILFQRDKVVGEIYSPGTDIKATQYVEHWVLYDGYIYPGKNHPGVVTTIKINPKINYESEADFFARAPWGEGYRYVRVDCAEFDRLPGR